MTPFRSDRDADLARIDALERELDAARRRVQDLEARQAARAVEPALPAAPAAPAAPARPSAPEPVQWRSWRAGGRWFREYIFERALPIEASHRLVRTLGERIGRRGRIELGPYGAAWIGGGRRFELAYRSRATVLTCTDAWSGDARLLCAVYIIALIAVCALTRDVSSVLGSTYVAAITCALAIRREPARALKSNELFEDVADLVGEELRVRGLPTRAALAAGDQGAR